MVKKTLSDQKKPLIIKPADSFDAIREVFRNGGVIAFPTETFYALGVDPFNVAAVKRLFALKGREQANPVSLIVRDRAMLSSVVSSVPPVAEPLMKKFWPGPLTIVFDARASIPPELVSGRGTVAVRVSGSPVCAKLLETLASPITATSANPSGGRPASTPEDVLGFFNGKIDVLIDGGKLPGTLASTIVDGREGKIKILREGGIAAGELLI